MTLLGGGCSDDNESADDQPDTPSVQAPSVQISAKSTAVESLTVTVTPANATSCAVLAVEEGSEEPSAATVLAQGLTTNAASASEVTIPDLKAETVYMVYAAVANEGTETGLASVRMSTGSIPSVTVEVKEAGLTSLTVEVSPLNATECAVLAVTADSEEPSAERILSEGVSADAEAVSTVELSGLEAETEYVVFAAVRNESATGEVARAEAQTLGAPRWK